MRLARPLPLLLALLPACGRAASRSEGPASSAAPAAASSSSPTREPGVPLFRVAIATEPVFVHDVAGSPMVATGAFLARLGTDVVQDPALLLGIEGNAEIVSVAGTFPDAAWLTAAVYSKLTGALSGKKTYRWYGTRWSPAASPLHDAPPLGTAEIGRGRTVALLRDDAGGLRLALVRGMEHVDPPALPPGEGACKSQLADEGARLVGVPSGQLFVIGARCGEKPARAAAWSLRLGDKALSPLALPASSGPATVAAHAARGEDVWLGGASGGSPYLLHLVAGAFVEVPTPLPGPIVSLSLAEDGTLWAASPSAIARLRAGVWSVTTRIGDAPLDAVTSIVGVSATRAWVGTAGASPSLLSTEARPRELALPDKKTMWAARTLVGRAVATEVCSSTWVPLSAIGNTGGFLPKDMPWLREGVRGHDELDDVTFVVDDDGIKLTLGAQVPSIDVGRKVLGLFADRLGISGAPVTCHVPRVVARYDFDRRTGEPTRRAR